MAESFLQIKLKRDRLTNGNREEETEATHEMKPNEKLFDIFKGNKIRKISLVFEVPKLIFPDWTRKGVPVIYFLCSCYQINSVTYPSP